MTAQVPTPAMQDALLTGNTVAWAMDTDRTGQPRLWSCVHRVFQNGFTFCSRRIPDSAVLVGPTGKPGNGKCSRCERMNATAARNRRDKSAGQPLGNPQVYRK